MLKPTTSIALELPMTRTRSPRRLATVALGVALGIGGASRLWAQGTPARGPFVSASLFGDVKRFSGDPSDNVLDGAAAGVGVALGTGLTERWQLEVRLDAPRSTEVVRERSVPLRSSTISLQSFTRNRATTVATLLRFTPGTGGRLRLGYLAGLSFLRLWQEFETTASASVPSSLIPRPMQSVEYAAAPTVGVDARLALSSHLSIVPALDAAAFRTRDTSGILLRPRVAVRWTF
jgi:hypothetical protein